MTDAAVVKMPYTGSRNVPEKSRGPDHVASGLLDLPVQTISLTEAQDRSEYGEWHRMGLACGHLATAVAGHLREGRFVIGLLGNCTALLGMLGGLQDATRDRRRIGLLMIDAHADFNTPETTLSGMLGGMPVAIAAGLCLSRLRLEAHLDPALPASNIVIAGLRDVDAMEQTLLDEHDVAQVAVDALGPAVQNLAGRVEMIYVHVDMDVLDPAEVGGHPLTVPGGPASDHLAATLRPVFEIEQVVALGIASTPPEDRDPDGLARRAACRIVAAAGGHSNRSPN